jgi:lactoylglutathione lyase
VTSRLLSSHRAILSTIRIGSMIQHPLCRSLPSPSISRTTLSTITTTTFSQQKSFTSQPGRPFQILGLQQVAIGAVDKSPLTNLWTNIFGIPQIDNYKSEKENVDEDILLLGKKGSPLAVEVDLMMPIDAEKSPKVHVPSLNHIGLWVDDLPVAVAWMESQGVRFTPGGVSS